MPIRGTVSALLTSGMTQKEIASALSISTRTVERIADETRADRDAAEDVLQQIQRRILKELPTDHTVSTMRKLLDVAEQTKQPSAGLSIIQYRDKLLGVVTEADRIRYVESRGSDGNRTAPVFMFQQGAQIAVTVNTTSDGSDKSLHNAPTATLTDGDHKHRDTILEAETVPAPSADTPTKENA